MTARIDYSRLDRPGSPVRIRLGSTVVRARNIGDRASPGAVEIAYFRGDEVYVVRAQSCVLACWNMMIPYLCPELPEPQKEALRSLVKTPLIYASVACATGPRSRRSVFRGSMRQVRIFRRSP